MVFGTAGCSSVTLKFFGSPIRDDADVKIIFFISFFLQDSSIFDNPIILTFALVIVSSKDAVSV